VKRVLALLEDLAQHHADKYATFWKEFGRVLKEGIADDTGNRERIAKLLRFASTRSGTDEQTVSLADYVARMKEKQDAVYYIPADSFAAARNSPHLEIFRKLGVEVLLMFDRVDEWLLSTLTDFDGKPLQSVARGGLDLAKLGSDAAQPEDSGTDAQQHGLVERMQQVLKERASAVRITHRLTDSPACLVSDEHGISTHLERMLKAAGQHVPTSRPILEINPGHPIVKRLADESDESRFADWSHILFDQATLAEGGQIDDPAGFVKRLNEVLLALAGVSTPRIWTPGN
jgi:molecular chaperone HtpG